MGGSGVGWALIRVWALVNFSASTASKRGAYSRWALIRGWALIRINTVSFKSLRRRTDHIGPQRRRSWGFVCGAGTRVEPLRTCAWKAKGWFSLTTESES